MKLYKLSQNINNGYDTYSDCVVCAKDEEEARLIHPSEFVTHHDESNWYGIYSTPGDGEYILEDSFPTWVLRKQISKIKVEYLGKAKEGSKKGVICASYHAG